MSQIKTEENDQHSKIFIRESNTEKRFSINVPSKPDKSNIDGCPIYKEPEISSTGCPRHKK